MTRFILFFAAAFTLFITACSKEDVIDTPENCIEGQVVGQYGTFNGTYQANGALSPSIVPDAETSLKTVSADCSRVSFTFLNTNSITFEANCTQTGDVINGISDDGKGTFSYNTASKKMNLTYQSTSGKYTITAVKEL